MPKLTFSMANKQITFGQMPMETGKLLILPKLLHYCVFVY